MAPLPPPGTFRLYAFAEPPLPAGRYTLTGAVTGLPGDVEAMPATVDVVAPRFTLPPDQVLGTFPPAGARGAFTSRLPQIVLRRRTLPWERSPDLVPGGTPTPWLALVLVAEGEGELRHDQPVDRCVTDGVSLPGERDVPKSTCLEVPQRVVDRIFPTEEDLAVLTHVREVDLRDTELAMGDDDGWMAVVLANRLPQPNTRYLACLVNLEGQWDELPQVPEAELETGYDRFTVVVDLRRLAVAAVGAGATADVAIMGLPGAEPATATDAPGTELAGPVVRSAEGAAVPTGTAWAAGPPATAATAATAAAAAAATVSAAAPVASERLGKLALGDGFAFPAVLAGERTLRFPVLAYWSFECEERGDFQYLAEHVTSRLLGYVPADPSSPDTPDGDPPPAGGASPPGAVPEPGAGRPLPLVAETGHVALDAVSRRGDAAQAWYRGPLVPSPVERATVRPDGDTLPDGTPRPPLAHHADQLRRVTPDGREDLGYAAAFEIGRLLALSQPGVAAAQGRWRQEAFGAARVSGLSTDAASELPAGLREALDLPDPLTEDTAERLRPGGAGRRTVRALLGLLGDDPEVVAPSRPLAEAAAGDDVTRLLRGGRDQVVTVGLGLSAALDGVDPGDVAAVSDALATAPALVAGQRDADGDALALRDALEAEAGRLADAPDGLAGFGDPGFSPGGAR
jgi:hypothetical protein